LVEVRDLRHCKQREDLILFTDQLTPDLAQNFSVIKGIVTFQGGLLSHLAILARETSIPIVAGFQWAELEDFLGYRVKIDGSLGTMTKWD
jgi:pyruvate,water dikinase